MLQHTTVIANETERFAEVLTGTDPAARVPTCPDWSALELAWHFTEVHAFWAEILRSGALTDDDMEAVEQAKPTNPEELEATLELLDGETAALIDQLNARQDGEAAWSWFADDQTVGFTRRMQVHEAVMHRIDAELTAGARVRPIPSEVAKDGVRHAIEVMFGWWGTLPGFTFTAAGGAVRLVFTDSDDTLLVQPGRWRGVGQSGKSYDEPGVVLVGAADPVASFTGNAEQLDRWLWGRGEEPAPVGDQAALDAVRAVVAEGMQ